MHEKLVVTHSGIEPNELQASTFDGQERSELAIGISRVRYSWRLVLEFCRAFTLARAAPPDKVRSVSFSTRYFPLFLRDEKRLISDRVYSYK